MKLTSAAVAVAAAGLVVAPVASAQTDGSSSPTGTVPSLLGLSLGQPKSAFSTFSSAKTYTTSFGVAVTTSEPKAQLSIADGEITSGSKIGRLANGSKLLPLPLEARVGKSAFAPIDASVDTPLAKWSQVVASEDVTVNLRQEVEKKTSGSYRKLLLVTLSTDTP